MIELPKVIIRNELPEDCYTAVFKLVCKFGITNLLKNLILVISTLNSQHEKYIQILISDLEMAASNYSERYKDE